MIPSVGLATEVLMSTTDSSAAGAEPGGPWWWCLKHEQVEPTEGCPNTVRMGPYATFEEAGRAIEHAHERNRAWDDDDV